MIKNHQEKIFEAMADSQFYPHEVSDVKQRETHISKVFMTGQYVYKIKKPFNFGFLDFTTLEKRKWFCEQEVILNRRLSNGVYIDVVPITYDKGKYFLCGKGDIVEYSVKMLQLPDNCSMITLLKEKKINKSDVEELSFILAKFYDQKAKPVQITHPELWANVWTNCEENFIQTEKFAGSVLDERLFQIIKSASLSFLRRRRELFYNRVLNKKVRDCHGDLKTDHIYFTDNGIQIIDCIEFNERFRFLDTASDLAFLAMDLDFAGSPQIGGYLLNKYVEYTKDHDVFVLMDFYKCYRAFVRCKINCLRLVEGNLDKTEEKNLIDETKTYLNLAYRYAINFSRPTIWVVCGMPASGKSTVCQKLASLFTIKSFNSDVVRKEMFFIKGEGEIDAKHSFEQGMYSKGASHLTYGKLLLLAQEKLELGRSVILDATYGDKHHRQEVLRMAHDMDVNIFFVECISPNETIKDRLKKRETKQTISDARIDNFDNFKMTFDPLHEIDDKIHIKVDTSKDLEDCIKNILSHTHIVM